MKPICARLAAAILLAGLSTQVAQADAPAEPKQPLFDGGKLLATSGVGQIEGAAGGGLTPWAVIAGYGTRDGIGASIHATYLGLGAFSFWSAGVAVGLYDRVELSYARSTFNTQDAGAEVGLGQNYKVHQDIVGLKIRLLGDAVYDQDRLLPQISAGAQYKRNDRGRLMKALGAQSGEGVDFYLSATKLFLAQCVLLNITLRETKANQFGILGFGGNKHDDYSLQAEASGAYLLSAQLAVGAEYRMKPDNLYVAREDDSWDVFATYFVNKHLALSAAYSDLGNIVIKDSQRGFYLSVQTGF